MRGVPTTGPPTPTGDREREWRARGSFIVSRTASEPVAGLRAVRPVPADSIGESACGGCPECGEGIRPGDPGISEGWGCIGGWDPGSGASGPGSVEWTDARGSCIDAWVSFDLHVVTLAFYLLGAAILHAKQVQVENSRADRDPVADVSEVFRRVELLDVPGGSLPCPIRLLARRPRMPGWRWMPSGCGA